MKFCSMIFALSHFAFGASALEIAVTTTGGEQQKPSRTANGKHHNKRGGHLPPQAQARVPDHVCDKFKKKNHLKEGVTPFIQELAAPSLEAPASVIEVDGKNISLNQNDLVPMDMFTPDATIVADGITITPEDFPAVFRSKDDESIVITKQAGPGGALVAAIKKDGGRTVRVVPMDLDNEDNRFYYATIDTDDVDEDQIDLLKLHGDSNEEDHDHSPLLLGSGPVNKKNQLQSAEKHGRRQLQSSSGSCASYEVIEFGLYLDSYFCANEGSAEAAYDRAVAVVAEASLPYEEFCKKLVIKEIQVFCDAQDDIMRPYVEAQEDSVCQNWHVLKNFTAIVAAGGPNVPSGDLVHMFSGKSYPNNARCIGQAWKGTPCKTNGRQTAINEMSGWSTNAMLMAHEAGHNLGASHDSTGVMTGSVCRDQCSFSSTSMAEINDVLDAAACVSTTAGTTSSPTKFPTTKPTAAPTSAAPTTAKPTTSSPTKSPTTKPTAAPTSAVPTTAKPTTSSPTKFPTTKPTAAPTSAAPTTAKPATSSPTKSPTTKPTTAPTSPEPVNSVTFGVFNDETCAVPSAQGSEAAIRETGPEECITFSYINPDGKSQTNSEHNFLCCKNFVVFIQYPGQDSCKVTENTELALYNVMTTECDPVQTHFGQTYQKLVGYDTPCSQTTDIYYGEDSIYAAYGDILTPELCNDDQFFPEGGSWPITSTAGTVKPTTASPTKSPSTMPSPAPTTATPTSTVPTESPSEAPTPSCSGHRARCESDADCCSGCCNSRNFCRGNGRRLGAPSWVN